MDVRGDVHRLLEERYTDSGAGPVVPCRGTEWVVSVARTSRVVDRCTRGVYQGGYTRVGYKQGPTHVSLASFIARMCLVS